MCGAVAIATNLSLKPAVLFHVACSGYPCFPFVPQCVNPCLKVGLIRSAMGILFFVLVLETYQFTDHPIS